MANRLDFHTKLVELFPGVPIYYQPPSNIQITTPCVIYSKQGRDEKFADDTLYANKTKYVVTIVDTNPDSTLPNNIDNQPLSSFERSYVSDSFYHDTYSIYY